MGCAGVFLCFFQDGCDALLTHFGQYVRFTGRQFVSGMLSISWNPATSYFVPKKFVRVGYTH